MKNLSYLGGAALIALALSLFLFRPEEPRVQKFTIETGYYPLGLVKKDGFNLNPRTIWVPSEKQRSHTITFYLNTSVMDALTARLQGLSHSVSLKDDPDKKLAWSLERKGDGTSFKIYQLQKEVWPRNKGC